MKRQYIAYKSSHIVLFHILVFSPIAMMHTLNIQIHVEHSKCIYKSKMRVKYRKSWHILSHLLLGELDAPLRHLGGLPGPRLSHQHNHLVLVHQLKERVAVLPHGEADPLPETINMFWATQKQFLTRVSFTCMQTDRPTDIYLPPSK